MFVLSSPSGVGKTTLAKMMLQHAEHLHVSISYTTRQIRPGEVDGKDYFSQTEIHFKNARSG